MPPRSRAQCQICNERGSRYTCPSSDCLVEYCSVSSIDGSGDETEITAREAPLRPLTSLKWPYVPEESAYPDPLKRDDPKALQTAQYEAIATSPAVRAALGTHPELKDVLRTIDGLRGSAREEALEACLGVGGGRGREGGESAAIVVPGKGMGKESEAIRGLAEAIEAAVRLSRQNLGLVWDPERE
ncbi:hypothetical protein BJV74DRAFT_878231 [Russula compacta]|nr:hypothetical protein BJV74DRAFT_878231 [Russula compacta]